MVSRYKRHLSLFLVMLLVMSWFVVPTNMANVPAAKAETTDPFDAPSGFKINGGYQFTYFNESAQPQNSVSFSWARARESNSTDRAAVPARYQIQYLAKSDAPRGMTAELCKASFSPWQTLAGSEKISDSQTTIKHINKNARDVTNQDIYFRLTATDATVTKPFGPFKTVGVQALSPPIPLACGKDPIFRVSTSCPSGNVTIRFTSEPTGATVTVSGQTLKQFANQDKSTTPVSVCVPRNTQRGLVNASTVEFKLAKYKTANRRVDFTKDELVEAKLESEASAKDSTTTSVADPSSGTSAGGSVAASGSASATAIAAFFGQLTNDTEKSLSTNTGDFDLLDDTTQPPDGQNDPIKPPILRIRGSKIGLGTDIDLPLTNVITVPERIKERNNNYFLFSLGSANLTEEQKSKIQEKGIDPAIIYFAVDVGGNLLVLIDDKAKNGGLFTTGKDRFDTGTATNLIAVGNPDGNQFGVSKNKSDQPFNVNIEQYKKTLTKRVYNDAVDFDFAKLFDYSTPDTLTCVADPPIHYPKLNTSYDPVNPFVKFQTPIGQARKCLNQDEEGWLKTWGVKIDRLDQVPADQCVQAFGNKGGWLSFITDTVAKSVCFVIGAIINAATWTAGFSIDFLIQAIGLQVR